MDDAMGLIQIGLINMCAGIEQVKWSPTESYCTLSDRWKHIPGGIFDMTQLNNAHQPWDLSNHPTKQQAIDKNI